jgi:DNA-binding MarR family transcriptional regulator
MNSIHSLLTIETLKEPLNTIKETIKDEDSITQTLILKELMDVIKPEAIKPLISNDYLTVTEIAKQLNMSKQKVGRIINTLHIKENPIISKSFIVKINEQKYTKVWFYKKNVINLIKSFN